MLHINFATFESFIPSSPSAFSAIVDSGATAHMFPFCSAFTTYGAMPGGYVILVNKQCISFMGIGMVVIWLEGYLVELKEVLHVPNFRSLLFLVHQYHQSVGCSFFADNGGVILSFPMFVISVDDSVDCLVSGYIPAHPYSIWQVYFLEHHVIHQVSAVSDNT